MRKYNIKINEKVTLSFKTPVGRKEVSYKQWSDAYKHIKISLKAKEEYEKGNINKASMLSVESMARIICALSKGVKYEDLIKLPISKLNNLFILEFSWLSNELPKRKFKVKNLKVEIPNFNKASAGDFMDTMSYLNLIKDKENHAELGVVIAAIYSKGGEYYQDEDNINKRIEFFKEHAKMDLFYSASFFLTSSLVNLKIPIKQHLSEKAQRVIVKTTSYLNAWVTTLCSPALQKVEY